MRSSPWRPGGVDLAGCAGIATNLYVIRESDGPLKIGLAVNPSDRLATLQQGNPRKLELVCTLPLRTEAEKRLHAVLRPDALEGEWFAPTPAVLAAVGELLELAALVQDYTAELGSLDVDEFDGILADWSEAA